ncbi:MAG: hypothetical protein HY455_03700 [Parcubacteria group bacterium]|nr:hypothetical protein [Parcubacteria group bacterium]
MKIFLIDFITEQLVKSAYELKGRGLDIVYWVGEKPYFAKACEDRDAFPNTIFHTTFDAVRGVPASGVSTELFEPPSKELIEEMLPCESQVLIMMNSIDYTGIPLARKKHLYYEYLSYWSGVLRHYKPDAVLFHDIPHLAHAYVLYCLAKKMNIKTIMQSPLRGVTDRLIFYDDFMNYSKLVSAYGDVKKKKFSLHDLGPDFQECYKSQRSLKLDPRPVYIRNNSYDRIEQAMRFFPSLGSVVRNIEHLTFFKTTAGYLWVLFRRRVLLSIDGLSYTGLGLKIQFLKWARKRRAFQREYESLVMPPDFSKKFVYVPLHFQPERSTSSEGGVFVDQILMIEMLSKALPRDWVIYVKEYNAQWKLTRAHLGRYEGYYQEILKLPNVVFLPVETSTFDLIQKSEAVATVTSTAGLEAILRQKPLLLFGYTWFMHYDEVFRVSNVSDCREAFKKIAHGFIPNEQGIIDFLAALEKISVVGHYRRGINKGREISDEENIRIVTEGYYNELHSGFQS